MDAALDTLTDKEKETLRLIVRGHDAKSAASELDLSVHTINERLRSARRKLDVTSSREAARLLLESEGVSIDTGPAADPQNLGHKAFGDASAPPSADPQATAPANRRLLWIGGIVMFLALSLAVTLSMAGPAPDAGPQTPSPEIAAADAVKKRAALDWLALVDAGKYEDAHAASSSQFREKLDLATFRSTTSTVRGPLGEVLSREVISIAHVEGQGTDYVIVRFRTDFTNQAGMVEQIALEHEGGQLRASGYFFI